MPIGSRTFSLVLVVRGTISTNEMRSGRIGSGVTVPTVRVVSLTASSFSVVVAEHVAVDVAVQVGVDGPVDGEGGVLRGEGRAVGEGDALADVECPLVGRGLSPAGGQHGLEVAGVGVALDEGLGDVGADDDAGGGERALARLEGRRLLLEDDAQRVGVVAAVAGVGDGTAAGGEGDSREGDGGGRGGAASR